MSRSLAVVLIAFAVFVSACSAVPEPPVAAVEPPPPQRPTVMPDLVGTRIDASASKLTAAGLRVTVVIPRQEVSTKDASSSGVYTGDLATSTIVVPEIRQPYERGSKWPQPVVSQRPAAGTETTPGTAVVLVGGRHPGGDPSHPFLWQHQQVIKKQGSQPCFECHDPPWCTNCHVRTTRRSY